jgi:hypothetical protein
MTKRSDGDTRRGDRPMQVETEQQQLTMGEKNDFVFRTLSDRANWTEDIVAGLMEKAHVAPNPSTDTCRKMAIKFLWMLNNSVKKNPEGKNWIPTRSCVDLTTTGASLTKEEESMSLDEVRELWSMEEASAKKTRRTKRHFVNCLGCGKRFLAKRANNTTCSPRCRQRAARRVSLSQIPAQPLLEHA